MTFGSLLYPVASDAFSQSRTPRDVQQALADRGYNVGVVDGVWGRRSITALKSFQASAGLPPTGVIDEATLERLIPRASIPPSGTISTPVASSPSVSEQSVDVAPAADAALKAPDETAPMKVPAAEIKVPQNIQPTPDLVEKQSSSGNDSASSVLWKIVFWGAVLFLGRAWWRGRSIRKAGAVACHPVAAQASVALTTPPRHSFSTKPIPAAVASADNDTLVEIIAPTPASPSANSEIKNSSLLNFHNNRAAPNKNSSEEKYSQQSAKPQVTGSSLWVSPSTPVTVGPFTITKGLIYVGPSLSKQGRLGDDENCLINPRYSIAKSGDPNGETMGYWPSYAQLAPSARYSYLQWLAGDRSDPITYIGYVFLYFYGLERRLMLEPSAPGNDAVINEVQRLLDVYGHNGSFNRYATDLLSAVQLGSGEPSEAFIANLQPNGFEIPTAIKIAIGVRVRDQRPIEPELLLRFAMTHPETRVRTPAKRAPEMLRELFITAATERYPKGYVMKPGRVKALKKRYRACSGTFEVDVEISGGMIPDVTDRAEPINTVRNLFNQCTDALDDYSRAVGRLPGLKPNLSAIAKLPSSLRRSAAETIETAPLAALETLASQQTTVTVAQIATITGIDLGDAPTKSKLRDISQLCAAFNLGVTCDPAYAIKVSGAGDDVIVFPLQPSQSAEATPYFRELQLSLMLGMIVGHADGHFHESERNAILERIQQAPDLTENDRLRLIAEVRLNEARPERLDDWMKRLKDIPPDAREAVATELISMAVADGELHADEIRKLELIFKRMGLAVNGLYDRLHSAHATREDPSVAVRSRPAPVGTKSPAIDITRLQSIRSETRITSSVLADIFTDEEEAAPISIEPVPDDVTSDGERFDGLEQRYGSLLMELIARQSWSAADFERLVREGGLMPGAAKEVINEWALDRFDDLLLEGDDPVDVNVHLLPSIPATKSDDVMESVSA
ncbi:MAG TPA: hypothetical protein DDW73_12720 [Rhizobium sp.]|jgi:uncharacterized tellurite resistance protein B-like protein|nr:hypothetical protein [Rhizobium sp.]